MISGQSPADRHTRFRQLGNRPGFFNDPKKIPRAAFLVFGAAGRRIPKPPSAGRLIADKGHDGDEFHEVLAARNIEACIPPKRNPKT